MHPQLDSASLQAFVQVAESGSFSIAAGKLFLTQSAISKRIAHLEEQVDCRLFDRIGRQISLTEAGRTLLPQARQILHALEDAARSLQNLSAEVNGRLSLAASHHISLHRLPPILRQYTRRYPEVELDLRFDESELAYDSILRGDLELALITLAPQSDPRVQTETLWVDSLQYVVARDHPLAAREPTRPDPVEPVSGPAARPQHLYPSTGAGTLFQAGTATQPGIEHQLSGYHPHDGTHRAGLEPAAGNSDRRRSDPAAN